MLDGVWGLAFSTLYHFILILSQLVSARACEVINVIDRPQAGRGREVWEVFVQEDLHLARRYYCHTNTCGNG